jgi:HSP20 family protein
MTIMTSWDLFDELRGAQDEMLQLNRMLGQWRLPSGQSGQRVETRPGTQAWAPAVDISERLDGYMVTVEMPGVGIEDLDITFEDGLLTIQGERHPEHEAAGEKVHRIERRYGTFRRSITLPSHVKADGIEASAQDGVLRILVPKAEEVHAKRIQVRAGNGKAALTGEAAVTSTAGQNGA